LHQMIVSKIKEAVETGKTIPKQFEVCQSYEPEDVEEENDDWAKKSHYGCKNCKDTIKLVGVNKAELHQTYYEPFNRLFPWKPYVNSLAVVSKAESAKDKEELYFADAHSFGHHSSGIALNGVDWQTDYRPNHLRGDALFFYRKIRDLDASGLQNILTEEKLTKKEKKKTREEERIAKIKQEEQRKMEAFLAIFK
jgi:hypothetical protein